MLQTPKANEQTSNLSTYTLKGIEFLEKVGGFVKERAALEEEYANRLKSLAKKYTKKYEDDELLKHSSYVQSFNGFLNQMENVADEHSAISENLKNEVVGFVSAKCVQHKSARKNIMNDLSTIDDDLNNCINELFKAKKTYFRSFREAENAYQKYQKADKNMDISRTELEKSRQFSQQKLEAAEKSKESYVDALECANYGQNKYFDKMLPMIFDRFRIIDKERIEDLREIMGKCLKIDREHQAIVEEFWRKSEKFGEFIDSDNDSMMLLDCFRSKIEKSASFELDDLGDPKIGCNRPIDYLERVEAFMSPIYKRKDSPIKIRSFRQLFKSQNSSPKSKNDENQEYSELPPKVRLRCLNAKIKKLEKQLETAIQGREGLNRLQNAYRENPKLGNPLNCNESLVEHAKEIERLSLEIEKIRLISSDVECAIIEAGDLTEGSFCGRDSTIDTTRSGMSGCSTNISSKTNTLDEAGLYSDGNSDCLPHIPSDLRFVSSKSSTNSSPMRNSAKFNISTPISRSNSPRQLYTPKREKSRKVGENREIEVGRAVVIYEFEGNSYGTISVKEGENVILIEKGNDEDGWMKVRRIPTSCDEKGEEGFVPSSYLKCAWNI